MNLLGKRFPTCPHCGKAELETEDVIDTCVDYIGKTYTEFAVGVCPNCERHFSYSQFYTLEPIGYEDLIDITDDEKEE